MRTTKLKTVISLILSLAMIVSTLAVLPAKKAEATYMPITTIDNLRLDLSDLFQDQLKRVPISEVLSRITASDGKPVTVSGSAVAYSLYSYNPNDDYHLISGTTDTIDFTPLLNYYSKNLEIICGAADQLNTSNTRYVCSQINMGTEITGSTLVKEDGSAITEQNVGYETTYGTTIDGTNLRYPGKIVYFDKDEKNLVGKLKYKLNVSQSLDFSNYTVKAYEGLFVSAEKIPANKEDYADKLFTDGVVVDVSEMTFYNKTWTVVFSKENEQHLAHYGMRLAFDSLVISNVSYLYPDKNGNGYVNGCSDYRSGRTNFSYIDNCNIETVTATYPIHESSSNNEWYFCPKVKYQAIDKAANVSDYVNKAVIGDFNSVEEAASAEDITQTLFTDGYKADYSQGITFTIFLTNGNIEKHIVKTEVTEATENDLTGIYFYGMYKENINNEYPSFEITDRHDSYYDYGYRGIIITDSYDYQTGEYTHVASDAAFKMRPYFSVSDGAKVYASQNGESGVQQESRVTTINYDPARPVHYTVVSEDELNETNYLVSIIGQQSGPKLFVNGLLDAQGNQNQSREVIFIGQRYHDIFFANVGDTDIEGLYVNLENAQNVKLDGYWNIGATNKLNKFSTLPNNKGYADNIGKIRLVPDGDNTGAVSGTLVIGYNGNGEQNEEIRINLEGIAGKPKITTNTLNDPVKYVPYSAKIQNDAMNLTGGTVKYEMENNDLPEGFVFKPTGELYGIADDSDYEDYEIWGNFFISVKMTYTYKSRNGQEYTSEDSKIFYFGIKDNTKENIEEINNDPVRGYKVLDYVPEEVDLSVVSGSGITFRSEGAFAQYRDLYMNGRKLVKGTDYSAEEGSTKITVFNQTLSNAGVGKYTLSAEFRDGGENGDMKTTSQIVNVTRLAPPAPSYSDSSSSSSTPSTSVSDTKKESEKSEDKKETKNEDGSVTVTTEKKNADGSTTTTEETKKTDGSVETKAVTKYKDGSEKIETKTVETDGTKITETQTNNADGTADYKRKEELPSGKTLTTTAKKSVEGEVEGSVVVKRPDGLKITKNYESNKDGGLTLTKIKTKYKTAVIPSNVTLFGEKMKVTEISAGALKGNLNVTKVKIGKNIVTISANAFKGASSLKNFVIKSNSIKEVKKSAFKGIADSPVFKFDMSNKDFKKMKELFEEVVPKGSSLKRIK